MKVGNGPKIQSGSQPPSNKSATNIVKNYASNTGSSTKQKSNSISNVKKSNTLNSMSLAEESNYLISGGQQLPQSNTSQSALQILNQKQLHNQTQYFTNVAGFSQTQLSLHQQKFSQDQIQSYQIKKNGIPIHERVNSTDSGAQN